MQQVKSRLEHYQALLDCIAHEMQLERQSVNRRMFSVLLWCFVLPVASAIVVLLMVNADWLPRSARASLDWLILVFPVAYTLYVLGSEVLVQIPSTLRRGGMVATLAQAAKDSHWRDRVCDGMKKAVDATASDWEWLHENLSMDIEKLKSRTRYLTALAGAVFFLLMQGIDLLDPKEPKATWIRTPVGYLETSSNDFSQFIGLGLFLLLFYVSGMQTYQSLLRYVECARLVVLSRKGREA